MLQGEVALCPRLCSPPGDLGRSMSPSRPRFIHLDGGQALSPPTPSGKGLNPEAHAQPWESLQPCVHLRLQAGRWNPSHSPHFGVPGV